MKKIVATMAGTVLEVLVQVGDEIHIGQEVVILESMKMEVPVEGDVAGKVIKIHVAPGDFVNEDDLLLEVGEGHG